MTSHAKRTNLFWTLFSWYSYIPVIDAILVRLFRLGDRFILILFFDLMEWSLSFFSYFVIHTRNCFCFFFSIGTTLHGIREGIWNMEYGIRI
jgi:hypothetical protein